MIKWEHSVLTLPFGLTGAVLAARGLPSLRQAVWLVVALVSARSAAMAFNRLADATIDAGNPRTAMRAIPAGLLSRQFVFWFVVVFSLILIFAARMLSQLAFYLSPVALVIIFGYSYTKRFTRWAHVFLGLAMGIAPAAAWVAIRGTLDPRIFIVTGAVMFWGGGFDILYSLPGLRARLPRQVVLRAAVLRHSEVAGAGAHVPPGCLRVVSVDGLRLRSRSGRACGSAAGGSVADL